MCFAWLSMGQQPPSTKHHLFVRLTAEFIVDGILTARVISPPARTAAKQNGRWTAKENGPFAGFDVATRKGGISRQKILQKGYVRVEGHNKNKAGEGFVARGSK